MLVNQHIGILSKQEIIFSYLFRYCIFMGFSGGSAGKESTCSEGDLSSIPGLGSGPECGTWRKGEGREKVKKGKGEGHS